MKIRKLFQKSKFLFFLGMYTVAIFQNFSVSGQRIDTIIFKPNPPVTAFMICKWGDQKRMELHPNGRIYQFKEGLMDGEYIAFYDNTLEKDTAMIVIIKNGRLNGLLKRWDDEFHYLSEEAEYKDGKLNGYRKLYFITPESDTLVNIEKWEEAIHHEDIQIEW